MLCFTQFFLTCTSTSFKKKKKILEDFQGCKRYEKQRAHIKCQVSTVKTRVAMREAAVPIGASRWACPGCGGAGTAQRRLETSLRVIITLLGSTIDRRTPCDLTNNILDHFLRADARMNFMVPFLSMTWSMLRAPR